MAASLTESFGIQPQDRDIAFLRDLFESRVMSSAHVATLHFNGSRESAKKRLQKLKAAGLITERRRRLNETSVLFLTRKAFNFLKTEGHLSGYPELGINSFEARASVSELTIRHELEVMDVKSSFHAAVRNSRKLSILEFGTWPLLYQFRATPSDYGSHEVTVKPDGFIRMHETDGTGEFDYHCFLEVDRSSEQQQVIVNRVACYVDYYYSGSYAIRSGGSADNPKEFPFRVLIILKSAERRNNTAERLIRCDPPILTMPWLTTMAEITADPLGSIWVTPAAYRDATDGTLYDTRSTISAFHYRRQAQREAFIETRIKKRSFNEG